MANLIISDTLAERLKQIAKRQNKPVDVVLENMIEQCHPDETKVTFPYKFSGEYEVWAPQTDEEGIATMYRVLEEYKRTKDVE